MPLVIIQASGLSAEQKKRIGERLFDSFHREGVPASSVVVLFRPSESDILLEGGLLIEHASEPAAVPQRPITPLATEPDPPDDFKSRSRRSKSELIELRAQLVRKLQSEGALSSFQAQDELGLKDCEWAPATLRRFFSELEEEGVIVKQGQKRGTRYVWKGITSQGQTTAAPRLVKRPGTQEEAEE